MIIGVYYHAISSGHSHVFHHVCHRVRLLEQVLIEEYHLHPECQVALGDVSP